MYELSRPVRKLLPWPQTLSLIRPQAMRINLLELMMYKSDLTSLSTTQTSYQNPITIVYRAKVLSSSVAVEKHCRSTPASPPPRPPRLQHRHSLLLAAHSLADEKRKDDRVDVRHEGAAHVYPAAARAVRLRDGLLRGRIEELRCG